MVSSSDKQSHSVTERKDICIFVPFAKQEKLTEPNALEAERTKKPRLLSVIFYRQRTSVYFSRLAPHLRNPQRLRF